ncbi:MAG: ferric uptake regulator, Fur family [Firmicutes bacterium]|nr:ferric uptake regulator, Fur family [Bacillota bacterium]
MSIDLIDLRRRFREKHYKVTPQRQKILEAFIEHREKHLSAEDVYSLLRSDAPDIGLATVYRTLEMLEELGFLHRIEFGDGKSRYELATGSSAHAHHHLICLSCSKVIEFDDDLLETLESFVSRTADFRITDHQVKFYGYCSECRKDRE